MKMAFSTEVWMTVLWTKRPSAACITLEFRIIIGGQQTQ